MILILILSVAPFLPAWRGESVFDDDVIAQDNIFTADPKLRAPAESLRGRFRQPRSLTRYTHGLTGRFGRAADHLFNIALHAANAVLVYTIARHFDKSLALPIAAIFAVHPLQVSSVAYTAARAGMLSFFMALLFVAEVIFIPEGPRWIFLLPWCWLGYKTKEDFPVYLTGISCAVLWFTWR